MRGLLGVCLNFKEGLPKQPILGQSCSNPGPPNRTPSLHRLAQLTTNQDSSSIRFPSRRSRSATSTPLFSSPQSSTLGTLYTTHHTFYPLLRGSHSLIVITRYRPTFLAFCFRTSNGLGCNHHRTTCNLLNRTDSISHTIAISFTCRSILRESLAQIAVYVCEERTDTFAHKGTTEVPVHRRSLRTYPHSIRARFVWQSRELSSRTLVEDHIPPT